MRPAAAATAAARRLRGFATKDAPLALPAPIADALVAPPALLALTWTPTSGRGLAARSASPPIRPGTTLLTAAPLATAPAPEQGSAFCHGCLAPSAARRPSSPSPHNPVAWCGPACEAAAVQAGWWEVEEGAGGFGELGAVAAASSLASSDGRASRFPTLAARLASDVLAAAVGGRQLPPSRLAADFLAAPRLAPPIPPAFSSAYAARVAGAARWVVRAGAQPTARAAAALVRSVVPEHAFAADMGRAHLNAFRVEEPAPLACPSFPFSSSDLATAAAGVVAGTSAVGSALYGLPSLINHSCTPNAAPAWGGRSGGRGGSGSGAPTLLHLVATREVAPGEAITISYIDDELPLRVRRSQLADGYGFECGCWRCVEEAAGGGG